MIALGSQNHPKLADGIHLRWGFERELGFPWGGFFLFRREHQEGNPINLNNQLTQFPPGTTSSPQIDLNWAKIYSNTPITFIHDFIPPGNISTILLYNRAFLRINFKYKVRKVILLVGHKSNQPITVKAIQNNTIVAIAESSGQNNSIHQLTIEYDGFQAIEIPKSSGVLINTSFVPFDQNLKFGWQLVENFQVPLQLPVFHPSYPLTSVISGNINDAWELAKSRIRFGNPDYFEGEHFEALYNRLIKLVEDGPEVQMCTKTETGIAQSEYNNESTHPSYTYNILDIVLLGAIHPAIAQMVGLYWVDNTVEIGQAYDYLIMGDWGRHLTTEYLLEQVFNKDDRDTIPLYGWIVFNQKKEPTPELPALNKLEVFSLPGTSVKNEKDELEHLFCNAGLNWPVEYGFLGGLPKNRSIRFRILRTKLEEEPHSEPANLENILSPINSEPILVRNNDDTNNNINYPGDWPQFPLCYIDSGISEGWYAYAIQGIDLFGRESQISSLACWYSNNHQTIKNQYAIFIKNKLPPPPPVGVEAKIIDLKDPFLQRDNLVAKWEENLTPEEKENNLLGLRINWQWPKKLDEQAPYTTEFRVYFNEGYLNILHGMIDNVIEQEYGFFLQTNIVNPDELTNQYANSFLFSNNKYFKITISAENPLQIYVVKNKTDSGTSPINGAFHIVIPPDNDAANNYRDRINWQKRLFVINKENQKTNYEIIIPTLNNNDRTPIPLFPSLSQPTVIGHIAISAADNNEGFPDEFQQSEDQPYGGRTGRESALSSPVMIYAIHRNKPPKPPVLPPDSEKVYASPADYHGNSYYTHRWNKSYSANNIEVNAENVRYQIFRAMDETLFKIDWNNVSQNKRSELNPDELHLFPDQNNEPDWDDLKRNTISDEINAIKNFSDYFNLSNDARRILAALPCTEKAYLKITNAPIDPTQPTNQDSIRKDSSPDYQPNPNLIAYTDKLDGRSQNCYFYRVATLDKANNISEMSLASVPIYIPDVVLPQSPRIYKITGGDRCITIQWYKNLESNIIQYHIYKTTDKNESRDIRFMEKIAEISEQISDNIITYQDINIPGNITYYYRITAIRETEITANNIQSIASLPSSTISARSYNTSPPQPPVNVQLSNIGGGRIKIEWNTAESNIRCLVQQRKEDSDLWINISSWLEPQNELDQENNWYYKCISYSLDMDSTYFYRLQLLNKAGKKIISDEYTL